MRIATKTIWYSKNDTEVHGEVGEILTEYENESEYTDRKLKIKQKQSGYLWRGNIWMPRWHIPSCDGGMCK